MELNDWLKMQQSRNSYKQQQQQQQSQTRERQPQPGKRLSHASGQNALSQNQLNANINNKLAANKAGSATPTTDTLGASSNGSIRSIKFRTQICNHINSTSNNNNTNKHVNNGQMRATSKAQDTFSNANSNCCVDGNGDADVREAHPFAPMPSAPPPQQQQQQQQSFQLPPERLEYYKLSCRINYGDFRQVHVQFHSSDRRCCAFSWKRKFRQRRQRQTQPLRPMQRRQRKRSQRCGVWLSNCQQRSRHNSLLSTSETQSNDDGEDEKVVVEGENNNANDFSAADGVVNAKKTPVAESDEVVCDSINNSNNAVAANDGASERVNVGERLPAESTAAIFHNAMDYSKCNFTNHSCVTAYYKPAADDDGAASNAAGVDLIDFTADAAEVDTRAFTDTTSTAVIEGISKTFATTEIETIADTLDRVTNTVADVNSATVELVDGDICSTLLLAAEVSGGDLLVVGDCKGVDLQKKKVNQIVDISNEWNASEQLTAEFVSDQNRGIGNVVNKNNKHADTPTELHEINHNNNSITTTTTITNGTTTATTTRTNSQTPSPILGHHGKKTATGTGAAAAIGVGGGTLLEKKSQSKLLATRGKALLQKSHQQQRCAEDAPVSTGATAVAERLNATELQRLKYLNRHSCNGRLDYEAIERHLEQTELQEDQRNKSIEALGVLLQYAVFDLDAFACPRVKVEKNKIEDYLTTTLKLLDEAKINCTQLHDQLCDKEGYYLEREEELQALHRCEMEKAQANLSDYQALAQDKFTALESQLREQTAEHKRTLDSYRLELDNKLSQKQQQLEAAEQREHKLKERFSALEISEQKLREQLTSTENAYTTRLQAATENENQLNERIKTLTRELESLRASKADRERELRDKLDLSQDEISVLRSSQRSFTESLERSSSSVICSPRNSSTSELARLQSEASSLHCVLELKQKEISKLTKQYEELMRDAEERTVLQGKISLLESSNEMLKSELDIKSEKEKDFLRQIDDMQKAYNHEQVKRKRLSYDNEALQWQLKQRSEQLHIVETKLHELSAMESFNTSAQSSLGSLNRSQLMNGSSLISIPTEDVSPPTSPVVKGVIEKPDSVSWVLEMDDDTPEAAASKMVKRAGSFRSVERSPSTRRQLSGCASNINTSLNCGGSGTMYGNGNSAAGPNPLSQSMSATSVIRQHSSDVRTDFNKRSHSRIRSKSVSVKGTEPGHPNVQCALNTGSVGTKSGKRLMRQSTSCGTRKQQQLDPINWQETQISSSSPHPIAQLARTSTMYSEVEEHTPKAAHDASFYQRTPIPNSGGSRKLITCDTSKLNSGERLDMQSLPTHASVHDLKKKIHEIQESAGEAMVSGTNSEDEGCSASSDEIVCSVSTSSATTGSTSSLKNSHMSLEEVLLLDKINSLNGTPMEVSWSDDPEVFTNGSTV